MTLFRSFTLLGITVLLIITLTHYGCKKEASPVTGEVSHEGVDLNIGAYSKLTTYIQALAEFQQNVQTTAVAGELPKNLTETWERVKGQFPIPPHLSNTDEFSFSDSDTVRVPSPFIEEYVLYLEAFEPIFDAINDIYDESHIPIGLERIVKNFEETIGITLYSEEVDEDDTISASEKRRRSTYCCCCTPYGELPWLAADCKTFRARPIWAKIRCFLRDFSSADYCESTDLFKKGSLKDCRQHYW